MERSYGFPSNHISKQTSSYRATKQKFTQKYETIPRILTCIQKVCKKTEIHAKIWPNIKNSSLHSKGMQKKQKFTQTFDLISRILTCIQKVCKKQKFTQKYDLISRILTCIQKVCKKTEIHAKIWPYNKNSNLHSKGMLKKQKFTQIKAAY